jgi:predicted esterase
MIMETKPLIKRLYVNAPLPLDYFEEGSTDKEPQEAILFLHGYEQKGQTLIQKLAKACPPDAKLIAPNGPFPIPRRTETGFKVGYSWYFYDPFQDEYLVDMKTSIQALTSVVDALRLAETPKRIIGFSQGGYLAPFVALALKNVKQVVGISCGYPIDELPSSVNFRWDGIHGKKDEIVDPEGSKRDHFRLEQLGIAGTYTLLENVGHELNDEVADTLRKVLV